MIAIGLVAAVPVLGAILAGGGPPHALAVEATKTTLVIHNTKHAVITSTTVGAEIHPFVTVTSTSTPTGNVVVSVYVSGICSGTPAMTSAATPLVNGAVDLTAFTVEGGSVGHLSFRASYEGNGGFGRSTSTCVDITFSKATPTVTVDWHDASHTAVTQVLVTKAAHIKVAVTGPSVTPTGQVTIEVHTAADCSDTVASPEVLTLASGAAESASKTFNAATSRYAKVTYGGNTIYNSRTSVCKPISWVKADATLGFVLHNASHGGVAGSQPIGILLHPSASASGPLGVPGGTYSVRRYAGSTCTGTTFTSTSIVLTNGSVDDATKQLPVVSSPTTFSYALSYGGSVTYSAALSACRTVIFKAPATVFQDVHTLSPHISVETVQEGIGFHDAATVAGDFGTPTGSAKVSLYLNGDCSGNPSTSVSVALVDGHLDQSISTNPGPGTYSFKTVYSGDGKYLSSSGCGAVKVLAAPATPTPAPPLPTPTLKPGDTPAPTATVGPGASTPAATTPGATGAVPPATIGPGFTSGPTRSLAPGETPVEGPGESLAPGETPVAEESFDESSSTTVPIRPSASSGAADPGNTSSSGGINPLILVLGVLLVVFVAGAWYFGVRKPRNKPGA